MLSLTTKEEQEEQRNIGPSQPEESRRSRGILVLHYQRRAGGAEEYWSFTTRGEQEEQRNIDHSVTEESRRSRGILVIQ